MNAKVVCFGESLWDLLPKGRVAGGAPMNVAVHLNNFGSQVSMISRIGEDEPGDALQQFLESKGLDTRWIQKDSQFPTGSVEVTLNEAGSPSYRIVPNVAWDHIEVDQKLLDLVAKADALVYGSLACRNDKSRKTLYSLIDACPGKKIFDLNLRAPHFNRYLIKDLMDRSDITKMNDEEMVMVANWFLNNQKLQTQMSELIDTCDLELLIMTEGSKGAYCHDGEMSYYQEGFPIKVKDTIGSGDSFFAAFIHHYLQDANPRECLKYACATGALVATFSGGTPPIDQQTIDSFIKDHT